MHAPRQVFFTKKCGCVESTNPDHRLVCTACSGGSQRALEMRLGALELLKQYQRTKPMFLRDFVKTYTGRGLEYVCGCIVLEATDAANADKNERTPTAQYVLCAAHAQVGTAHPERVMLFSRQCTGCFLMLGSRGTTAWETEVGTCAAHRLPQGEEDAIWDAARRSLIN